MGSIGPSHREQTPGEERWNVGTHFAGAVLIIIGGLILLFKKDMTALQVWGVWVYTMGTFSLFVASTIYHWVKRPRRKRYWRIIDHIAIYYIIAGTYTPVILNHLWPDGEYLLWLVWSIAAVGTVLKLYFTGRFKVLSSGLYLAMGYLLFLEYSAIYDALSTTQFRYLLAGGFFYTVGIIFYQLDNRKYFHSVWHFFVLCGAAAHYGMVYLSYR